VLTPGVVLSDRYRLTERIAAGGMGEVWRGVDLLLRRGVAVKVLLPTLMADGEFIARFRREARVMAAMRHPGIVQVYDYGENVGVDGRRLDYLVMEFIDGTPLSKRIEGAGRLPVAETMTIVAQVADALQVAHDAGIVHRDVKPSNILVRQGGAIVLVDFGVARSAAMEGLTGTNVVLGSAHYMAPEQAEGKPVTPATDVYALGAVAYCCVTGRPPYVGDNPLQVLAQLVMADPPTLPVEVPPQAAAVVMRALAKDPARRFPSAAALAAAARAVPQFTRAPGRFAPAAPQRGSASGSFPVSRQPAPPPATPAGGFRSGSASIPPAAGYGAASGAASVPPRDINPATNGGGAGSGNGDRNRRRNATLAAIGAAVLVAVVGIGTVIALHPTQSEATTPTGPDLGVAGQAGNGRDPGIRTNPTKPGANPATKTTRSHPTTAATTAPAAGDPGTDPTGDPSPPGDPASSSAATNPHTPKAVCGSSFSVIDQAALKSADGAVLGRVYLLYNDSTTKNCVVTLKATDVGTATAASAYLEVKGADRVTDSGSFEYYAGPVRAQAGATCVKWGGSIGDATYDSPFEHCG
jgi:serine/threonine protein kinase